MKASKKLLGGVAIGGVVVALLVYVLFFSGIMVSNAGPSKAGGKQTEATVQINGVLVDSEANYYDGKEKKVYVDVHKYAGLLKKEVDVSGNNKSAAIDGNNFNTFVKNGKLMADVEAIAHATGGDEITFDDVSSVYVLDMPDHAVHYHPPLPGMGQHWVVVEGGENMTPEELEEAVSFPETIIYGSWKGKLLFIEQMVSSADMNEGKSWTELKGMEGVPSPAIHHTDFELQAEGHPGFPERHYDIHHYFVPHAEHMEIVPEEMEGH